MRLGLARTFQRASLFADLTVREHLTLAARGQAPAGARVGRGGSAAERRSTSRRCCGRRSVEPRPATARRQPLARRHSRRRAGAWRWSCRRGCCCSTSRCPASIPSSATRFASTLRDVREPPRGHGRARRARRRVGGAPGRPARRAGLRRQAGRRPDVGDRHQHQGARGVLRQWGARVTRDRRWTPRRRSRRRRCASSTSATPTARCRRCSDVTHRGAGRHRVRRPRPERRREVDAGRGDRRGRPRRPGIGAARRRGRQPMPALRPGPAGHGVRARGRARCSPGSRWPRTSSSATAARPASSARRRSNGRRRCSRSSPSGGTSGPGMLSGGEQQMVSLSRVLVQPSAGRGHRRAVARPGPGDRRPALHRAGQRSAAR